MKLTKTVAAGLLAASLAITPATAQSVQTPAPSSKISTEVVVLGLVALAVTAIIVGSTMTGGDSFRFSSKDIKGTDGNPLPGSPSMTNRTVVMDF